MRTLLVLFFITIATPCFAQCVAEVKDVNIDKVRGSIVIETQYKLNGVIVDARAMPSPLFIGKTRYTEDTGTIQQIVTKAKADIQEHCESLIIKNAVRTNGLDEQKLLIQKAETEPLLTTLKTNAIGFTKTVAEKTITYKGKSINVQADGSYTITDLP